jgi:hypothetical protein
VNDLVLLLFKLPTSDELLAITSLTRSAVEDSSLSLLLLGLDEKHNNDDNANQ